MSFSEAGKLGGIAAAETSAINKQKRIDAWNKNPKLCKTCTEPLLYENRRNNFCDHSCAAIFNNKGVRRHGEVPSDCLNCGKPHYNEKFCSHECNSDYDWEETKSKLVSLGVDNSAANKAAKRYLTELHNGCCQICELNEWRGKPMPLVLDHINGNPYNNTLTNLRVICHNCNAQTPTFAGRNKGNGRFERAKRWKIEKEAFDKIKADVV